MIIVGSLLLSGCSPVVRAAIRINSDGTLDFAACTTIVEVQTAVANATSQSDPGDDDQPRSLELVTDLSDVREGQVVTFSGLPEDWDEVEVFVYGKRGGAVQGVRYDKVEIGEWYWDDGWSLIPTIWATEERCAIE